MPPSSPPPRTQSARTAAPPEGPPGAPKTRPPRTWPGHAAAIGVRAPPRLRLSLRLRRCLFLLQRLSLARLGLRLGGTCQCAVERVAYPRQGLSV
eukprot:scaffold43650_cov48-Phaeocystis_antarctica.AAC.6